MVPNKEMEILDMKFISAFGLTIGVLAICIGSSQAAKKDCGSEIKRVEAMMPPNLSAGKSAMAKAELRIAAEKAANKDEKACLMHVDTAEKSIK